MDFHVNPAREEHVSLVAGWTLDAEELERWCGRRDYPLEAEVVLSWQTEADVRAFVLEGDTTLAYGELWLDETENEVELARIIVNPDRRGRGVGREFVRRLLEAARETGYPTAFLRVVPDNLVAIRCYEAAGFARVEQSQEQAFNQGQPRAYAWYRHPL
jgi:ribosomal protein S18 acetylase RimI-like enzyme